MSLPKLPVVTRKLLATKDEELRDTLVESFASTVPQDWEQELPPVQTFTDINVLFNSDYHALIEGRTGSGKTTLLLTLLNSFLHRGHTVLLRDDGGLEFPYLACFHPTRIFIPDVPDVELILHGFKAEIVRVKEPIEIIHAVYDYSFPLNVIVYDVFSNTVAQRARFYSGLFFGLITTLQRMMRHQKKKMVLAIDELNDLIPPRGKGSPEAQGTRADIELNIRKVRKHKVQILASSHRFNQIGMDTRSQFELIFFKKSYGYDVWDFLSRNLITSHSKTFWAMVKRLLTLPRNQFVLFNENRNFDLYTFPDIPRLPGVDTEALGSIPVQTEKTTRDEKVWLPRVVKAVKILQDMGWTQQRIAEALGMQQSNLNALL